MSAPKFLVVEDNAKFARCVVRLLARHGSMIAVGTVHDAIDALAVHRDLSALIVDLDLPDGSGLEVLTKFRATHPALPALVLTGSWEPAAMNRAYDLRADYLLKPFNGARLDQFVEAKIPRAAELQSAQSDVAAQATDVPGVIAERLEQIAKRYGLTSAEADLIVACLHGLSRKEYIEARALSVNTYKTRARMALKKLSANSLGEVRDRLLRSL